MGGALIGGTVDATGAVTAAGTALGKLGQTTAVQYIDRVHCVCCGVFFTARDKKGTEKVSYKNWAFVWPSRA
ncbi:MAG: hypothetical protein IJG65_05540 [Synergistaceae bacterium]|nr:hypothetical protein [Synergistaceae bacterium]